MDLQAQDGMSEALDKALSARMKVFRDKLYKQSDPIFTGKQPKRGKRQAEAVKRAH